MRDAGSTQDCSSAIGARDVEKWILLAGLGGIKLPDARTIGEVAQAPRRNPNSRPDS